MNGFPAASAALRKCCFRLFPRIGVFRALLFALHTPWPQAADLKNIHAVLRLGEFLQTSDHSLRFDAGKLRPFLIHFVVINDQFQKERHFETRTLGSTRSTHMCFTLLIASALKGE